jgi:nitrite reductase/ring-hydroxylating ferredoxin subunit
MDMHVADFGPEAYTQGDQFQREKRGLFAGVWLPFCATAQVASPGEFVNHSLGGWPIFVLRGADNVLRAFQNTCRHQNMPVVDKPAGRCDQLRCRFHGWVYDLSGALTTAPPVVAPPDMSTQRLHTLPLAESDGVAFVRIGAAGDAPPALGLSYDRFAVAVTTDVTCNWKTMVEELLLDGAWRFVWPIAFVRDIGGASIVRQVVPRTFNRTRLVDLAFAAADSPDLQARLTTLAGETKAQAEALQSRRAAGDVAADRPQVREFRARVAAASPAQA